MIIYSEVCYGFCFLYLLIKIFITKAVCKYIPSIAEGMSSGPETGVYDGHRVLRYEFG